MSQDDEDELPKEPIGIPAQFVTTFNGFDVACNVDLQLYDCVLRVRIGGLVVETIVPCIHFQLMDGPPMLRLFYPDVGTLHCEVPLVIPLGAPVY